MSECGKAAGKLVPYTSGSIACHYICNYLYCSPEPAPHIVSTYIYAFNFTSSVFGSSRATSPPDFHPRLPPHSTKTPP